MNCSRLLLALQNKKISSNSFRRTLFSPGRGRNRWHGQHGSSPGDGGRGATDHGLPGAGARFGPTGRWKLFEKNTERLLRSLVRPATSSLPCWASCKRCQKATQPNKQLNHVKPLETVWPGCWYLSKFAIVKLTMFFLLPTVCDNAQSFCSFLLQHQ